MPAAVDIDRDELLRLRAAGIPQKRIAEILGCSRKTICNRLHAMGAVRPRKPAVKVVKAREQVRNVAPVAARAWFEV